MTSEFHFFYVSDFSVCVVFGECFMQIQYSIFTCGCPSVRTCTSGVKKLVCVSVSSTFWGVTANQAIFGIIFSLRLNHISVLDWLKCLACKSLHF